VFKPFDFPHPAIRRVARAIAVIFMSFLVLFTNISSYKYSTV